MRYFELRQAKYIHNPIKIQLARKGQYKYNMTQEQFDALKDVTVGYYEYDECVEMPDVLEGDTFFVSNELKKVFTMYDDTISFKGLQVYPFGMVEKVMPLYWCFYTHNVACLHESVKIYPNGDIEEVILERNKIPPLDIFKIDGTATYRVIVTLPVAESILRRKMYGVSLKEVMVR